MRADQREADTRPWVMIVGGFLGTGKTTLLLAAGKNCSDADYARP